MYLVTLYSYGKSEDNQEENWDGMVGVWKVYGKELNVMLIAMSHTL
jgi:hypothetical protein